MMGGKLKCSLRNSWHINHAVEKSSDIIADLNFPNHIFCPAEKADFMEELLLSEGLLL